MSINATALASDKTYANQLKAAALLEPWLAKYPDHPGVAHYLIHTYDYTELAGKGLPAASLHQHCPFGAPRIAHATPYLFAGRKLKGLAFSDFG